MLNKFFSAKLSRRAAILLPVLSISMVIFITRWGVIIDRRISFYVLYAIPISVTSWFVNRWTGMLVASITTLSWFAADVINHPTSPTSILVFNTMIRLPFFVSMAVILNALRRKLETETRLAHLDPLTGLMNRRYFLELADAELMRLKRYDRPFTLAYVDIDDFKLVNDQGGHHAGDDVLQMVAEVLRKSVRRNDFAGRHGGDEFVVLFPETPKSSAPPVVRKLHHELTLMGRGLKFPVTFSIGAVTFSDAPESIEEALRVADTLMYRAKLAGKNCTTHETYHPSLSMFEKEPIMPDQGR